MKKNIAVNISGVLYPIDEDAYELLKRYLDNMRAYFSRQEGGKEIADDIESRAAELMGELHGGNNTPVTIEDVQYIINRIGSPEELGGVYDDDARTEPSSGLMQVKSMVCLRCLSGQLKNCIATLSTKYSVVCLPDLDII